MQQRLTFVQGGYARLAFIFRNFFFNLLMIAFIFVVLFFSLLLGYSTAARSYEHEPVMFDSAVLSSNHTRTRDPLLSRNNWRKDYRVWLWQGIKQRNHFPFLVNSVTSSRNRGHRGRRECVTVSILFKFQRDTFHMRKFISEATNTLNIDKIKTLRLLYTLAALENSNFAGNRYQNY